MNIFGQIGFLAAVSLMGCAGAHTEEVAMTLYVATNGNNEWSGRLAEPNAAGTDGPLATLAGARDAIRKMKPGMKPPCAVRVLVRGGSYFMTEPVTFGPEDSGSADAPVSYEAYPGEEPVLHGGRIITGWKQEGDLWAADIAEVREGAWKFSALWVNGERRTPARVPNAHHPAGDEPTEDELFYIDGPVMEKDKSGKEGKSATRFRYRPGDIKAWDGMDEAVVVVFHSWETALLRPKNVDDENRIIEFTGPTSWGFAKWRNDQRYFVEHLFEALDKPGEWCLKHKTGTLYYMPMEGEKIGDTEVVAPVAKQLVLLKGNPAEGRFVEHLNFRGIRFHYAEYAVRPQGHSDSQAAFSVPAAFEATGARHCTVERCEIGHVGTYGVWFRSGCQDNRLAHCEVFDLGAGGVRIGEGRSPASDNEAALRNVVDNCFIHDGGRIFRSAVGLWIGRSSYNTISHNEICDFRYTGVSVGWSWGYAQSSAHHNIIEYNHVHHVGHGQLSDMGAIYMLGVSPGTIIRYNLFHDVMSNARVSGGWGIYFDEGSTDILAENNVVYNTLTGTLHQHYGKENRVRNNVFAFSHREQLIRSREEKHISFFFERNIVYFNNGLLLRHQWHDDNYRFDNNCYWDTSGVELDFAGRTIEEWQAEGNDKHSIVADPLFVNPEAGDFRLKPDSPALKLGFKPINLTDTGLYGEPDWVNRPRLIPREPFAPPKPPEPTRITDGFEQTPVGGKAAGARTFDENGAASILVTDETAASGKHSLKFTDAPGLKHAYNPHLVYSPHLRVGTAIGRFAIRMEPGAILLHEWRDNRRPYRVGPSISINAAGQLAVGGKKLLTVPHSQWVRIEIECVLGRQADGTFDITVTPPRRQPQRFKGLACGHKMFRRIDWYGFVSTATDKVVMYLDDVRLASGRPLVAAPDRR